MDIRYNFIEECRDYSFDDRSCAYCRGRRHCVYLVGRDMKEPVFDCAKGGCRLYCDGRTPEAPEPDAKPEPRPVRHRERIKFLKIAKAGFTAEECESRLDAGEPIKDIAKSFGVNPATLLKFRKANGLKVGHRNKRVFRHGDEAQRAKYLDMYVRGYSAAQIAAEFGATLCALYEWRTREKLPRTSRAYPIKKSKSKLKSE